MNDKAHDCFYSCQKCVDKLVNQVTVKSIVKNWRIMFVNGAYVDVRASSFQTLPISQVIAFMDANNDLVFQVPIKFAPTITQLY